MKKEAFTLIELLISIVILSIMMTFLYKSMHSLNFSNMILKEEVENTKNIQKIKSVLFKDFSLAKYKSVQSINMDKDEDFVSLQTQNSLHKRYAPFVTYLVKKNKLYRLESLQKINDRELEHDSKFDIDYIGDIESFRVYKSLKLEQELYLVHLLFKSKEEILLKLKVLNEE